MSWHHNDPVRMYLREVAGIRPLTAQDEADLWRRVWSGDEIEVEIAKKRLIEANLWLVVSAAERYSASGVSMLDLIQKGNESLMAALESFSENSTGAFPDHAAACIERALSEFVREWRPPEE